MLSRLSTDTAAVKNAATTNISMFLRGSANVLIGLAMCFWTSWDLTLLTLVVTPLASVFIISYGRFVRKLGLGFRIKFEGLV